MAAKRTAPRGTAVRNTQGGAWRPGFLAALAETCNVSESCRVSGVTRKTVYQHRAADAGFAAAWDSAVIAGEPRLRTAKRVGKPGWMTARMGAGKRRGEACVYLVSCEGFHKIGISTNLPARMVAMQSSCPFPVELVVAMTTAGRAEAAALEDSLHDECWQWHQRGEWFLLPPSVASRVAARLAGCCDG